MKTARSKESGRILCLKKTCFVLWMTRVKAPRGLDQVKHQNVEILVEMVRVFVFRGQTVLHRYSHKRSWECWVVRRIGPSYSINVTRPARLGQHKECESFSKWHLGFLENQLLSNSHWYSHFILLLPAPKTGILGHSTVKWTWKMKSEVTDFYLSLINSDSTHAEPSKKCFYCIKFFLIKELLSNYQ